MVLTDILDVKTIDPGVYQTNLQRDFPWYMNAMVKVIGRAHPIHGAYTEMFAAFDDKVGEEKPGVFSKSI